MQPYSRVLLLISIVFLALIQTGNAQAYAEGQRFVFRAKMGVLAVPPQTSIDISLSYETPFGLTLGEPVDVETILEGDANGVTYRPATLTFMPGLSVDSATGAVTGIPTGDEGAAYAIAVEAVKDGKVVATTEVLERILREPLRVEVVPDDILLTAGDDFPSEGTAATASGGDPDTIGWSLESAPAWLAIKPGITAREVHLARADGVEMTPSSPTVVTLVVYDAEGREDRSRTFNAGILPAILKLLAEDGAANDQFGYSVALSADGGTALLGMPYDDFDGNTNAGAAYVFRRDGDAWVQQAKLVSEPRGYSGSFGSDVALSADGRTALVGAKTARGVHPTSPNTETGAAYVFRLNGSNWVQEVAFWPTVTGAHYCLGGFGNSVSLSADGDKALVGAPYDRGGRYTCSTWGEHQAGSAFVFERNGGSWTQTTRLVSAAKQRNGYFGTAVSLSADGNTALVGASSEATGGNAYVFENLSPTATSVSRSPTARLKAPDSADGSALGDKFGHVVALSGDGDTALIGASHDTPQGTDSGSAYIFSGWVPDVDLPPWETDEGGTGGSGEGSGQINGFEAKLVAPDGAYRNLFGSSVSLSHDGSIALIGAAGFDVPSTYAGSAYLFSRNAGAWASLRKLTAFDRASNDAFGFGVALSSDGQTALVSAARDDDNGSSSGSGYVFSMP